MMILSPTSSLVARPLGWVACSLRCGHSPPGYEKKFVRASHVRFNQPFLKQILREDLWYRFGRWFGIYNDVFGDNQQLKPKLNWDPKWWRIRSNPRASCLESHAMASEQHHRWWIVRKSMSTLFGNNLDELTDVAKAAYLTFLGPKVAEDIMVRQAAYKEP